MLWHDPIAEYAHRTPRICDRSNIITGNVPFLTERLADDLEISGMLVGIFLWPGNVQL